MTQKQANTAQAVVIFRRWKDTGEVIALFPHEKEGPAHCSSFMHIGQHGPASYNSVIKATVPASALTDQDVRDLAKELTSDPYNYHLKPVLRVNYSRR